MDDLEQSRLESGDKSSLPRRDDEILLERLKQEPPVKQQAPFALTFGIIAVVLALAVALFFLFRKPEVFVNQSPPTAADVHTDSSELTNKRMRLGGKLDSLEAAVRENPHDHHALLNLANTYYDGEYWDQARMTYEHYLEHEPSNANARIDYAYTIAQSSGDFPLAVSVIDTALTYEPEHVQGLFNAGLLSLRANVDNKEAALKSARQYFTRAKSAAAKQGNTIMSQQIDEILKEMERVGTSPAAR